MFKKFKNENKSDLKKLENAIIKAVDYRVSIENPQIKIKTRSLKKEQKLQKNIEKYLTRIQQDLNIGLILAAENVIEWRADIRDQMVNKFKENPTQGLLTLVSKYQECELVTPQWKDRITGLLGPDKDLDLISNHLVERGIKSKTFFTIQERFNKLILKFEENSAGTPKLDNILREMSELMTLADENYNTNDLCKYLHSLYKDDKSLNSSSLRLDDSKPSSPSTVFYDSGKDDYDLDGYDSDEYEEVEDEECKESGM